MTIVSGGGSSRSVQGVLLLLPAFLIWGGSPVYWKSLAHVPSFELLLHRTVWSLVFLLAIVLVQGSFNELITVFKSPVTLGILTGTTLVLAFNWFLFIWAINHGQVLQTSLGYYINPLIMVLLGMIFLKERLRRLQLIALCIAGGGVLYYALGLGQFPWIALALAFSFGFYGLCHKLIAISSLTGLCVETLLLTVPAGGYLAWQYTHGRGAMGHVGLTTDLLLVGTSLVTALPLLFFIIGSRRTTLATVGFMQYIAPSCTFMLAVFVYREAFSMERLATFVMIWIALALYSLDSVHTYRKSRRKAAV
ncbi:MAG: EamA family transporter RarD [Pseudomonadota bacterium]